jgi:hypothetical protein
LPTWAPQTAVGVWVTCGDRMFRRTSPAARNGGGCTCPAPCVPVAVAEQALERYYATVSQQQITHAMATPTTTEPAKGSGQSIAPVQIYRSRSDDQRRLLNQALFHRLYLADDRITDEP